MTYIIYRDSKYKIISYSVYTKPPDNLDNLITEFNQKNETNTDSSKKAEIAVTDDIISLIELAEKNKNIKESDLRSIEDKFDDLQNEIYMLKECLNENM